MKTRSIKYRLTLWFSCAVIIISGVSVSATLLISRSVIHKGLRDDLIHVVENNVDEVEYYEEFSYLEVLDPYDIYLSYGDGFLEIDDDFIRNVNSISTSLYDEKGLIYGNSSILPPGDEYPFSDSVVRYIRTDSGKYYVYDKKIAGDAGELWLRGIVTAESTISQVSGIVKIVLMFIPVLMLLAIVGGYIIARRAMKPVVEINSAAESISEGNDLSRRIDIGDGSDELHSIADSFNAMLERLELSFKKEQQLTSDISHELRTPVTVIYSQCQLSSEIDTTPEDYQNSINIIERQSEKMSAIINDMLSFARLERGAEKIALKRTDLSECVKSVCDDMLHAGERNITLQKDIDENVFILGSEELLARLISNLISNAYRYGKGNGHIFVTLKAEGENAVLEVQDDGIGISKNDIGKIFDRFYRADLSRSSSGTGLGLSFAKEIAEIHGADISVESELGIGSTFKINFKKI